MSNSRVTITLGRSGQVSSSSSLRTFLYLCFSAPIESVRKKGLGAINEIV